MVKHWYLKHLTRETGSANRESRYWFLSVLSHELKAPLNAIKGYLQIMKEHQLGDKLDNYDKIINRCLDRLQGIWILITDLIELKRIETEENQRQIMPIDIVQIAKLAIDIVKPMAIQKNLKLHFDAPQELIFVCSETEMQSIFNNLLSNAIKYNKEEGQIFFSLHDFTDKVIIEVEDTGIGMTEEEQKLLFKEFSRIKNEKTRTIPGSGLGLYIVKRIVDLYNGQIHVNSRPDVGTKFTIILSKEQKTEYWTKK